MNTNIKGTDKEGRIRLGGKFANKYWQLAELDNGSIVLIPMITSATEEEVYVAFEKMVKKHEKTLDLLK